MQKEVTKSKTQVKKYGTPFGRKHLLRRGDIRLIQKATGFAYITIVQQLDGTRAINPAVLAMADKLADNNQNLINAINNIPV